MQKQIAQTLLAQSFIPLFTSVVPRIMSPTFAYLNIKSKYSGEIVICLMYWFPPMSLLSTIVFIVPFRRYCLGFLPCSQHHKSPKNSVQVFVNNNGTRAFTNNRSSTNNFIA